MHIELGRHWGTVGRPLFKKLSSPGQEGREPTGKPIRRHNPGPVCFQAAVVTGTEMLPWPLMNLLTHNPAESHSRTQTELLI